MNQPLIDAYLDELLAPVAGDAAGSMPAATPPAENDDFARAAVAEAVADATADALAVALLDDAGDVATEPTAVDAVTDAGTGAAGTPVMASFDADALAAELLAEFDRETQAASAPRATPPATSKPAASKSHAAAAAAPPAPIPAAPAARAPAAPKFELPESFAPVPPPQPVREPAAPALRAKDNRARGVAHPGRWLRVSVDADRYAVELLRVQEVVRIVPIVGMRGADPAVLGVMNLRGRIVPVFDLGLWLGTTAVRPDERSRIVVVERDDELIGLLVTAVNDVTTLVADHIEPPLGAGHPGAIVGVARADDAPTVLLDANWLFD
jgi:chemotaxis signal transduction protein